MKNTLKVDKGNYIVLGEARIHINQAVVCTELRKETEQSMKWYDKILYKTLQKQDVGYIGLNYAVILRDE